MKTHEIDRRRGWPLTVAALLGAVLASSAPGQVAAPSLEERLETMIERLDARREALHVPGLAIAIVKDDEVILARGLGLADIDGDRPVTPETIFAIGSTTKAFTSALVGTLVDEGKMTWDDPVVLYLPDFTPKPDGDGEITIRDMLCHRTGFTRMGILWAGGAVPRDQILRTASGAEPWAPFRRSWHYNNVMYLAAGMAAGVAADQTWDELVQHRLLGPLGMESATTRVREAQEDPRLAVGYRWNEETEHFDVMPMRTLDTIAPAGAINANAIDMAKWVRLQLGRGAIDGRRLVSEAAIRETWTPQIEMPGAEYGLGWMLRNWNGQPVVEHGGNIDGFAAQVALLPESGVGFVLLANVIATPLQGEAMAMVWNAVLPPPPAPPGDADGFDEYLGVFIANFASFKDAEFEVLEQNGSLAIDVPGQTIYELNPPDADGKWFFTVTDQIALSFARNEETNAVISLTMYQGGLEFEAPRAGVEIVGEIDVADLQKYLGTFHLDAMGADLDVLIQNGRLAVDVPGQMIYELHPPDDDGRWVFRVTDAVALTFTPDDTGRISVMTMHQAGQALDAQRVGAPADLPSVEDVRTLRKAEERMAALAAMGVFRIKGSVRMANSGVEGTVSIIAEGTDRYRQEIHFGEFGQVTIALNGNRAWSESTFSPFDELLGQYLDEARNTHPAALIADFGGFFDSVEVVRRDEVDGEPVIVLKLTGGDGPKQTVFLSAATGDVLRADTRTLLPGIGALPTSTRYGDYREVHGLRIPFSVTSTNDANGRTELRLDSIEIDQAAPEGIFTLTPPDPVPPTR